MCRTEQLILGACRGTQGYEEGVGTSGTCPGNVKEIAEILYWKRFIWPDCWSKVLGPVCIGKQKPGRISE